MPTNLPAEYYAVEERYKAATDPQQKISLLEEMISTVPKHKGTDHLRADMRRRLSKMKAATQGKKASSRHVTPFHVEPEGAAQVVLIGPPNSGKSALLRALTNASPEVAPFPFTTWTPTPGMMEVHHVQIQLIDTPPLNPDYIEPAFMDLIRRVDLVLLVIDLQQDTIEGLEQSAALLQQQHIVPDQWQDQYEQPRRLWLKPMLVVVNKCDSVADEEDFEVLCELLGDTWQMIPASAETGYGLQQLKEAVFDRLGLMRVFSQPPGKEPDMTAPFVLPIGSTVEDFAGKVHKDFLENLKVARVWGSSVFAGQEVARDYVLQDGDVVELRA